MSEINYLEALLAEKKRFDEFKQKITTAMEGWVFRALKAEHDEEQALVALGMLKIRYAEMSLYKGEPCDL